MDMAERLIDGPCRTWGTRVLGVTHDRWMTQSRQSTACLRSN